MAPADAKGARFPFVFAHAFNASSTDDWSFNGVKEALEADGHFVHLADLQPFNGSPARAAQLVVEMDQARTDFCHAKRPEQPQGDCLAETKVHIIGHSQGGLDARWAISKLGYAPHTASLTTIGTPHRGTPLGDVGLKLLASPIADVIGDALFKAIGETRARQDLADDVDLHDAIFWLSRQRAEDPEFDTPNADGVDYESWAGIATVNGAAAAPQECEGKMLGAVSGAFEGLSDAMFLPLIPAFSGPDDRPNDGHIPVSSAKWGTFRGCLPADHLDLIGRPASQHRGMSPRTGFDHIAFYRVIARERADRGQ